MMTEIKKPKEGTKLRDLYELFMSNKGIVLEVNNTEHPYAAKAIDQLNDFYDLDIKKIKRGQWRLCGQYVGKEYVAF